MVRRNLSDIHLIPPYDQVVLENVFTKIDEWSISLLRESVLEANDSIKKSQLNLCRSKSDFSIGVLPCSRFMMSALGMLTMEYSTAGLSMLLNNGLLALAQVN